jgi:sugar-specific transcriptional regulator TrmB/DNA-binding CsgD family transcriptional regulator
MKDPALLETLGLGTDEVVVYEALLEHGHSSQPQICEATLMSARQVRTALAALESRSLVSRTSGKPQRFAPAPPDVALEALVLKRQDELERVRIVAGHLAAKFHASQATSDAAQVVEVLNSVDAVVHRFAQLQNEAVNEVLILDSPPYRVSDTPPVNDAELDALARGVTYRVVYDRAALEAMAPDAFAEIGSYVSAGEQARLTPVLPLKLAIIDRRVAVVPLRTQQVALHCCIVVHPCSLLDALIYIFESLWESAQEVGLATETVDSPERSPGTTVQDRQILALLAAGMKDEAIAHHLGHSHRTVRRRIAALMDVLGSQTRFQAGIAATKRGWI